MKKKLLTSIILLASLVGLTGCIGQKTTSSSVESVASSNTEVCSSEETVNFYGHGGRVGLRAMAKLENKFFILNDELTDELTSEGLFLKENSTEMMKIALVENNKTVFILTSDGSGSISADMPATFDVDSWLESVIAYNEEISNA